MSVLIIAEAGVNHNGDIRLAYNLIDAAKEAGADCIKFQTFKSENLVSRHAQKAAYQQSSTPQHETQLEMLRRLELSFDDFRSLKFYCDQADIKFTSTPFDLESLDFLVDLEMDFWKIPSGEITNLPYLIAMAQTRKKILLSTGMSDLAEVNTAVNVLQQNGCIDLTLLHCTTEYPAPLSDVNLLAIKTMQEYFALPVGYSDHTLGIDIAIAAVALGASVIEKHFTLDKAMEGPDHQASLDPHELKLMIQSIRRVETALGTGEKTPAVSEIKNRAIARKSIVAKTQIQKGELFAEANLTVKRPGTGISPMSWFDLLGKPANKDYQIDELIDL